MVDPHEQLPVKIVFLLAMQDASRQLIVLKYLMRAFQDKESIHKLALATQVEEVIAIWQKIWKYC
jgi:mannitol/fructose-specific phosphotransferase system IIA component (Ntr-type)